jgi:hypothetical protein
VTRYEAQVRAALGAVELRSPDAFLWFGRREATGGADGGTDARERLVRRIAERLHEDFFSAGAPRPRHGGPVTAPDEGGEFVRALSQANGGRGAWQGGWRIAAPAEDGALRVVRADGLALLAPDEHVRAEDEDEAVAGARATVLLPKELRGLSPGFYIALGDSGSPTGDGLAGLYWNVAAAGAVTLVARVGYALNGAGLPFAFELLGNPARYGRGDAAVLLVARTDVAAVTKLLRPLLRALGPHLAAEAPAFTKPLTRGLALAEAPAGTTRFGEQRCRLLAEAIVSADKAGARTADARLAIVAEHFAAAGVSLDAPYLQPGSIDAYELP